LRTHDHDNNGTPPAIVYARLLRELSDFIRGGQRETDEAEAVADKMDGPWRQLTEAEETRLRGHATDLNDLTDGTSMAVHMSAQQEAAWREEGRPLLGFAGGVGDPDRALAFLRLPYPASLPPGTIALWKARCWEKLGYRDTALFYFQLASDQSARSLLAG
jgi:hypothetical protein